MISSRVCLANLHKDLNWGHIICYNKHMGMAWSIVERDCALCFSAAELVNLPESSSIRFEEYVKIQC